MSMRVLSNKSVRAIIKYIVREIIYGLRFGFLYIVLPICYKALFTRA